MEEHEYGTTVDSLPALSADEERLFLAVVGDGSVQTYQLPDSGALSIGRSDQNDVFIDDPMVSRNHAVLHVDRGEFLFVEDLGGTNGTSLSGEPIQSKERVPVVPGQVIEIASAMLVVQRRAKKKKPQRLWPHGYFEMRLEEECDRGSSKLAVLWIEAPKDADRTEVEGALAAALEPSDVVARYAPGQYELLLSVATPRRAEAAVSTIRDQLYVYQISVCIGVAAYPENGRTPAALIAHARERATERPAPTSASASQVIIAEPKMVDLYRVAGKVAKGRISVLLLGETGVGKEVLAETVHRESPRGSGPFLRLNCGALTETLLEAELFGYEKGAFTGADKAKPGLLESADSGTVFLDEVGELPQAIQVKLLRVLEHGEVQRLGALKPRPIDVRFVSATNRDLEADLSTGQFREDLFFRLNGVSLTIPPLRERPSEIMPLAESFVALAAKEANVTPPVIAPAAEELLMKYDWPGNIRELRNTMERAVLLCSREVIAPQNLPVEKMSTSWLLRPAPKRVAPTPSPVHELGGHAVTVGAGPPDVDLSRFSEEEQEERDRVVKALESCGGNQTRAAKLLSVSRKTLVKKIAKYDLPRPRK